jgi:hypothetical protein
MKKQIINFLIFLGAIGLLVAPFKCSGQLRSACGYSTCTPQIGFNNTDLLQIYGAILTTSTGGTSTVTISSGTITGNVGGYTAKPQSTLTADGTYATAALNIGGVQSFTASRTNQRSGLINDMTIWDPSGANAALVIDIYASAPTGTFVNNTIQVLTDPAAYLGSISVATVDWIKTGPVSRVNITNLGIPYYSQSATLLYYTVQTTATATFGANTTLTFGFGILQD